MTTTTFFTEDPQAQLSDALVWYTRHKNDLRPFNGIDPDVTRIFEIAEDAAGIVLNADDYEHPLVAELVGLIQAVQS
jgi:hypothetical protein